MTEELKAVMVGTLAVSALMLALWWIHLLIKNAAIVDAGWAGGLALLAAIYAGMAGEGRPRAMLMGAMAVVWGLRLALYLLFTRVIGHPEEGRYVELRRQWGGSLAFKFFLFFQLQGLLGVVLSAPFLLAAVNRAPGLSRLEVAAAGLWLIAFGGELLADLQLARFKADPASRGKVCEQGLWRYSRHPNYFFEWLIWVAYALYALGSPYGYLGLVSPALILFFLFRITGIPATEEQALRSRGDAYRTYQQTTSAFVPWFRKGI